MNDFGWSGNSVSMWEADDSYYRLEPDEWCYGQRESKRRDENVVHTTDDLEYLERNYHE